VAGGDASKINMVWDWDDTLHDLASNTTGWLAATLLRQRATADDQRQTAPVG
jgi:hypothetical protein